MSITLINPFISFPAAAGGIDDPTDISDLIFWYDADDVYDGSDPSDDDQIGGSGVEWMDKSGNNYDLAQSNASKQPVFKTSIQNGKPGILFDGTATSLGTSISNQGYYQTLVFAWNITSDSGQYFCDGASNGRRLLRDSGGDLFRIFSASGFTTNATISYSASLVFVFFDDGDVYVRQNGTDSNSSTIFDYPMIDWYLGSDYTGGNNASGYIFENFAYNRIITSQEITDIENYINSKWSI